MSRRLLGTIVALTASLIAVDTSAEPLDPTPPSNTPSSWDLELAGVAAYLTPPVHGGTTPFGAGFGGRLGAVVGRFYLGGRALGFLGGTDVSATTRSVLGGAEIGYNIRIPTASSVYFDIRPRVGLGGAALIHSEPLSSSSTTTATGRRSSTTPRTTTDTVDILAGASGQSGSGGSGVASNTTTSTSFYVEPGVTAVIASRTSSPFAAINATMLILPNVNYGDLPMPTWISYGLSGELGLRF